MTQREKVMLPVKLEKGLIDDMEDMIRKEKFSSKAEIIRYGIRLVSLLENQKDMGMNGGNGTKIGVGMEPHEGVDIGKNLVSKKISK